MKQAHFNLNTFLLVTNEGKVEWEINRWFGMASAVMQGLYRLSW